MEDKIKVKRGWHCTIIENQVINSDISCHAKMVYVVLCMYANKDDKTCYPSLKTICKDTSIKSKTTVKKGIDELIEKGFLEVISRKGDKGTNESNLYIIKDYPISGDGIGQEMIQGRPEDDAPLYQEMTHPISGDGHELKPINESQNNNIYTNEIYDYWLLKAKHINNAKHTDNLEKEINKAIKKYGKDSILKAIDNYVQVFDSDYYYSATFTLINFLKQSNCIPRFIEGVDEKYNGDIYRGYKIKFHSIANMEKPYWSNIDS